MSLKKCQTDNIKCAEAMNCYSFSPDRYCYCDKARRKAYLGVLNGNETPEMMKLVKESEEKQKDRMCETCTLYLDEPKRDIKKHINQDPKRYISHLEKKLRKQRQTIANKDFWVAAERIAEWRTKFYDLDEVCQELIKENAELMALVKKLNSNQNE